MVLVPVPATAAAVRARHGDHMHRLARRAAADLRRDGYDAAVATPLRALPRADSAELDRRAAGRGRPRRVRGAAGGVAAGGSARGGRPGRGRAGGRRTHDRRDAGRGHPAAARKWIAVTFAATLAATRLRGR